MENKFGIKVLILIMDIRLRYVVI